MLGTRLTPPLPAAGVHSSQDGRAHVCTAASPEASVTASPSLDAERLCEGGGAGAAGPVRTGSVSLHSPRNPASGRMPRAVGCPVSKDRGPDEGTLDSSGKGLLTSRSSLMVKVPALAHRALPGACLCPAHSEPPEAGGGGGPVLGD